MVRRRIIEVLNTRRERYVEICQYLIAIAPPDYVRDQTPEAARQMAFGHLAMVVEALEGRGSEAKSTYIEGLIPSLIKNGVPLRGIVGGTVHFAMLIAADVERHLPQDDRVAASEWLAGFYADYITELAALVAGGAPPA
jgi:hypothetical protein